MRDAKTELEYYKNLLELTRRAKVGMRDIFDSQEKRIENKINELSKSLKLKKKGRKRK